MHRPTLAYCARRFSLLLCCLFASVAQADRLVWPALDSPKNWMVDDDSFHLSLDLNYLSTDYNYNDRGQRYRPLLLAGLNSFSGRIHAGFSLGNYFSLFLQGQFVRVEDNLAELPGISRGVQNTRTALGDTFVAVRYLLGSNRLAGGRFSTASEIDPGVMRFIAESGVNFPFYPRANPATGEHSVDWQTMIRALWFPYRWSSLSLGTGYTYRNGRYAHEIPFQVRADFYLTEKAEFRAWLSYFGHMAINSPRGNEAMFSSGSLLYGPFNSSRGSVSGGIGYFPGPAWEIGLQFTESIHGRNTWNGWEGTFAIAYRPLASSTTGFYNPKRDLEIGGLAKPAGFAGYDLHMPIIEVGKKGRHFKVGYGLADGLHIEDTVHVFENAKLTKEGPEREHFIGAGTVVAVRNDAAVVKLRVLQGNSNVRPGMEARRIIKKDAEGVRRLYP